MVKKSALIIGSFCITQERRKLILHGWEGGSRGSRCMYTYGWFMSLYDKSQQNIVKQLSSTWKLKIATDTHTKTTEQKMQNLKWYIHNDHNYVKLCLYNQQDRKNYKTGNLESCVLSCSHVQLCDPMDCSMPGSSVHGILQAGRLGWIAMPSSTGSSQPRDQTHVSYIAGSLFTVWAPREALTFLYYLLSHW